MNSSKQRELSVLLTEDDANVAKYLMTVLRTLGHQIAALATDGLQAVQFARELNPDLIIMDINLPELDGIAATRKILADRNVPVIISTGRTDGEALERARELNIQAYLIKPFSMVQLKSAIAVAMMQHQVHNDARRKISELSEALETAHSSSDAEVLTPARLTGIGLTKREAEVMHWIAQGKSNGEIATILESSPRTVAKHVEHIFLKLKVESRIAAVTEARRMLEELKES